MPAVQVNSNLSNWKPTLLTHCYGHLTRYKEGKSSPPYGSSREKAWIWCVALYLLRIILSFATQKFIPLWRSLHPKINAILRKPILDVKLQKYPLSFVMSGWGVSCLLWECSGNYLVFYGRWVKVSIFCGTNFEL